MIPSPTDLRIVVSNLHHALGIAPSETIDLLRSLLDYAEKYAELSDEPAGGDCREVLARAGALLG